MDRRLIVVAIVVAGALAATGCTTKIVTSEGAVPLNTVTSSGTGTSLAAPDTAEMYFGVTVLEPEAKAALDTAGESAEAIVSAIKDAGIPADDVQTANVSVYPEYSGSEGKAPTVTGYRANVQVRVKIRDLDKIGDVIGAASGAGATDIGGPNFTLDDRDGAEDAAIDDAIADARRRAETMAKAAGKTLGEIISVSEAGVTVPPIYYGGLGRAEAADYSVAIEPGQLDVAANVTVVFELK